jgi:glutaminyl-peptide cyclotransferase
MVPQSLLLLLLLALAPARPVGAPAIRLEVSVLKTFEHDPSLFTQGLVLDEGAFLESSGRYGRSFVRRWRLGDRSPVREVRLDDRYFAEGLALVGDRLIVLTYHEAEALILDPETFEREGQYGFSGEGWGLCYDGRDLLMSNGSSYLSRRSSTDFAEMDRVQVILDGKPIDKLNELECAEGWVYANVWQSDVILRIDPHSGRVDAIIDASGLLPPSERSGVGVLNGIAYDSSTETFFLTGKLWPKIFEVEFVER